MKSSEKEDIYRLSVDRQRGRFLKLQFHNNTSKKDLGAKMCRKRNVRRREVLKCSGFVDT